jgi:TatD DNase family protein
VFDSHCHLDVEAFDLDREAVIGRATAAGVTAMLVPAIRPRTWAALIELARHHASLQIALGVHPQIVPALEAGEADELAVALTRAVAEAADVVVAIGECGLDGGVADQPRQAELFRVQLRVARALKLPVIVHVLRAHDVAPRILREEHVMDVGGVLHSYSGGAGLVGVYRDLGLAFSFAGPITYPNARRPIEAARLVPDDLLLVETDAPDQAAAVHRGSRSEPAQLAAVIAGLASARGTTPEAIAQLTAANARRIFRRSA